MSTPFLPTPIRLLFDRALPFGNQVDINTSQTPQIVAGDDAQVDFGLAETLPGTTQPAAQNNLLAGLANSGAGGVATVTLQVWLSESDASASPQISGVVTGLDISLTQVEWNDGISAYSHGSFVIPGSATALTFAGATGNYWLRAFVTTSDSPAKTVTVYEGPILFKAAPISTVSAPPAAGFKIVTDVTTGLSSIAIHGPDGNYRVLQVDIVGGVASLSLSDQTY